MPNIAVLVIQVPGGFIVRWRGALGALSEVPHGTKSETHHLTVGGDQSQCYFLAQQEDCCMRKTWDEPAGLAPVEQQP